MIWYELFYKQYKFSQSNILRQRIFESYDKIVDLLVDTIYEIKELRMEDSGGVQKF